MQRELQPTEGQNQRLYAMNLMFNWMGAFMNRQANRLVREIANDR